MGMGKLSRLRRQIKKDPTAWYDANWGLRGRKFAARELCRSNKNKPRRFVPSVWGHAYGAFVKHTLRNIQRSSRLALVGNADAGAGSDGG